MSPTEREKNEQYEEREAQQRFQAALKGAMNASHKPLKEKPKAKETAKKPKRKKAS
jgi:hypothetical protein